MRFTGRWWWFAAVRRPTGQTDAGREKKTCSQVRCGEIRKRKKEGDGIFPLLLFCVHVEVCCGADVEVNFKQRILLGILPSPRWGEHPSWEGMKKAAPRDIPPLLSARVPHAALQKCKCGSIIHSLSSFPVPLQSQAGQESRAFRSRSSRSPSALAGRQQSFYGNSGWGGKEDSW